MRYINPTGANMKDVHGVTVLQDSFDPEKDRQDQADDDKKKELSDPRMFYVNLAREARDASVSYFEVTRQRELQDSLDNFASRHPSGSRYWTKGYEDRSRMFQPKTRIVARQLEEEAAQTFFSSEDLISVKPVNVNSQEDQFYASVHERMLKRRFEDDLPFFEMVIGGVQDAFKQGDVISAVGWESEEEMQPIGAYDSNVFDGETGDMLHSQGDMRMEPSIKYNRPTFRLIPLEHIHIDPGANWADPIGTSPFVIEDIPMHIGNVKSRMTGLGTPNGWYEYPETQILSATVKSDTQEALRAKRQGDTIDPMTQQGYRTVSDHKMVMVHRVIMQIDGEDFLWYTLGNLLILSDPIPLREAVLWLGEGERDYQWGFSQLETHRTYKPGIGELFKDLQGEVNVERNARADAIAQALARRYKIRRDSVTDYESLENMVTGGYYEVEEMDDVEQEQWSEIPGSSFFNEDRLANDLAAMGGSFDQGGIASQRNMNETVGGMRMASTAAGRSRSYIILTITATWWKKVCEDLLKMEKAFATEDEIIDAVDEVLADKEQVPDLQPSEIMEVKTRVSVNMRLGTDPMTRVGNLMGFTDQFMQTPFAPRIDYESLYKEGAGAVGFGDGDRFILPAQDDDPEKEQLRQQIAELEQMLETKQVETQAKVQVAEINQRGRMEQIEAQERTKIMIADLEHQIEQSEVDVKEAKTEIERNEHELNKEALIHQVNVARFEMKRELKGLTEQESESTASGKSGTLARDDYGKQPERTG